MYYLVKSWDLQSNFRYWWSKTCLNFTTPCLIFFALPLSCKNAGGHHNLGQALCGSWWQSSWPRDQGLRGFFMVEVVRSADQDINIFLFLIILIQHDHNTPDSMSAVHKHMCICKLCIYIYLHYCLIYATSKSSFPKNLSSGRSGLGMKLQPFDACWCTHSTCAKDLQVHDPRRLTFWSSLWWISSLKAWTI